MTGSHATPKENPFPRKGKLIGKSYWKWQIIRKATNFENNYSLLCIGVEVSLYIIIGYKNK